MTDIYVSDLFGHKISNNSPIIIINSSNTSKLMNIIASEPKSGTSIWEYNKEVINDLLKIRNVDPDLFLPMGHVLYKQNNPPKTLVLGNSNWFNTANRCVNVMNYSNGKICKPYLETDNGQIDSLGLIYLQNDKSSVPKICVLPSMILTNISKQSNDDLDTTEFNLLASPKLGFKTIARNELLSNKSRNIKLLNANNNYLSFVDSEAKTKQLQTSVPQSFTYNAQGELTTDGKCLSYSNNSVSVQKCDNKNKNQKWLLSQNKILPSNDFNKCLEANLSSGESPVYLKECSDSSLGQSWGTENSDSDSSFEYTWDKYQGKTVVLVENDNPWYVNSDTTIQKPVKLPPFKLYDDIKYRENDDYKSDFIIDKNDPTLGFGYSFADRSGIPCNQINGIEGFGSIKKYSTDIQIICIIIIIALLLIFYKYWQ